MAKFVQNLMVIFGITSQISQYLPGQKATDIYRRIFSAANKTKQKLTPRAECGRTIEGVSVIDI